MQVNAQKLSTVLVELEVEIDAARVNEELDKSYKSLGRTARLRGFRPGKAPRHVLAKLFGPRVQGEVAQRLVETTLDEAVKAQSLQTVGRPEVDFATVDSGKAFAYKARLQVLPQLEEVSYDGLEAQKPKVEVVDADVEAEIDQLRRANSTLEPLEEERGAAEGDVISVDLTVLVGGEEIEDAGTKDYDIELGRSNVLPEIAEAVTGAKAGQQLEREVELPAHHPHPRLRGKKATFRISVSDVKRRVLPAADDEFAKDLGDYDTLADLQKEIRERLLKEAEQRAKESVAQALVDALVVANPIEVPPALVDQQAQLTEQEVLAQARRAGQRGALGAEVRGEIRKDSEKKVRAGLVMAEIAKREGIVIGDAELEEGLTELAEQTGKNVARLRAEYAEQSKREMLIGMILESKVLDIIESKAKIEEPAAE